MKFTGQFIDDKGKEVSCWFKAADEAQLREHLEKHGWKIVRVHEEQKSGTDELCDAVMHFLKRLPHVLMKLLYYGWGVLPIVSWGVVIYWRNHPNNLMPESRSPYRFNENLIEDWICKNVSHFIYCSAAITLCFMIISGAWNLLLFIPNSWGSVRIIVATILGMYFSGYIICMFLDWENPRERRKE